MHSAHLWHKFYLPRLKVILLFTGLLVFDLAYSQGLKSRKIRSENEPVINLPNYDTKLLHYGFFIALNYDRFNLTLSQYYVNSPDIIYCKAQGQGGFGLGFLMNFRLADQWAFRILPSVGFYERDIEYMYSANYINNLPVQYGISQINTQQMESTFLEMQFLMKYRSQRRKNTRMYFVGGFKPGVNAAGKKADNDISLRYSAYDFTIEYGVGLECYFPLFKFSPELRFSNGLVNMLQSSPIPASEAIQRISTNTVSLYFLFE